MRKTLKLKYGEYYDLKITDASKNIINQVEITPVKITTDLLQLTPNSIRRDMDTQELDRGMTEQQTQEDCFNTWQYVRGRIPFNAQTLSLGNGPNFTINHVPNTSPLCKGRELQIEVQIRKRYWITKLIPFPKIITVQKKVWRLFRGWVWEPRQVWTIGFKPFRFKSQWHYSWNNTVATPSIFPAIGDNWAGEDPNRYIGNTTCRIDLNRNQLEAMRNVDSKDWADIELLNWRYKLTGGEINIEKMPKQVFSDFESQLLRGVHSYTYPESTLIQEDARVGDSSLAGHIANHILDRYKHGREIMTLKWQGDPRITIGDSIVLEDKMGIETEYMVTGNQFNLDPSGKFSMYTEGISMVSV